MCQSTRLAAAGALGGGGQSPRSLCIPATHPCGYLNPIRDVGGDRHGQGSRALLAAHARQGVVIQVDSIDGDLTVT
jgi:hypothetical protein